MARTPFREVNITDDSILFPTPKKPKVVDWSKCFLCQESKKDESLIDPNRNKSLISRDNAYKNLSENLLQFDDLGVLPQFVNLNALKGRSLSLEENLRKERALYHKSCALRFCRLKLERALKQSEAADKENYTPQRCTRSIIPVSPVYEEKCIFCHEVGTRSDTLSVCKTDHGASRIMEAAVALKREEILLLAADKPLKGNARYHSGCRTEFFNQRRSLEAGSDRKRSQSQAHDLVLASMVSYMREERQESAQPLVWKMADLTRMYASEMEALGEKCDAHSTRLRESLLEMCPELESSGTAGQDIVVAFRKDINDCITQDCRRDYNEEAHHLSRAAEVVRRDVFEKKSVLSLQALTRMVMQSCDPTAENEEDDQFVKTISDLLAFHMTKRARRGKWKRHNQDRETATPIYVAMKLYGETRKKELVDKFCALGLCISYHRMQVILEEKASATAALYRQQNLVCPEEMRQNVFTTFSVDNIDHNTTSTTAQTCFHGTAICVSQHPRPGNVGEKRSLVATDSVGLAPRTKFQLPDEYSSVKISFLDQKNGNPTARPSCVPSPQTRSAYEGEASWLNACQMADTCVPWGVFHCKEDLHPPQGKEFRTRTAVLPLFHEQAHSMKMMVHSMRIALKTTHILHQSQTPVIVGDQPLYAHLKSIQWQVDELAENKIFVMMGGLHIEMAAMRLIGQWLNGSGWVEILLEAEVTTRGRAESMIHASSLTRTRYAHQVTVASLYQLQREAWEAVTTDDPVSFDDWRQEMRKKSPHFLFWDITLNLELIVLEMLRAMRTADFELYKSSLVKLAPWFFALDQFHYARWLPVHINDLLNLQEMHPDLFQYFQAGLFVGRLSERQGSAVPLDHVHENANLGMKGDGGMIGLTENRSSLLKWCLVTPHLHEMNSDFEKRFFGDSAKDVALGHHTDTATARASFRKHLSAMTACLREAGNPFLEEGEDFYNLNSKVVFMAKVKESVFKVENLGESQYRTYVQQRLESTEVSFGSPIRLNKLPLCSAKLTAQPKLQNQVKTLKETCNVLGALFVANDCTEGSDEEKTDFYSREVLDKPPSISVQGKIRTTAKAKIQGCVTEGMEEAHFGEEGPPVDAKVLDGAAIVHVIKPTNCTNFADYQRKFLGFLRSEIEQVSRVDVVWDRYDENSLKNMTRENRGIGIRRRVLPSTKIPDKGWEIFLRNSDNKTELFHYLAEGVRDLHIPGKTLCSTQGEQVILCPLQDIPTLAPCNHEEADTRIFVHVADSSRCGNKRILIRTSDSDVLVIAISTMEQLPLVKELWVHLRAGQRNKYFPVHEIASTLGPSKSAALIGFHAFTGCDTVSSFLGHGKPKAWDALKAYPHAEEAFIMISKGDVEMAKDLLVNFVIAMYSPSKMYPTLTVCRRALHTKQERSVENLPPTLDTLEHHILRASYQAQVWRQATALIQELPSPDECGWQLDDSGMWTPLWKTVEAVKGMKILIRCGCKTVCRGKCKCSKNNKHCTPRCKCNCKSATIE